MASDKRDFSNFKEFPGSIIDGRYQFPVLHHIGGKDKHRIWKIQVRLIKLDSKKTKYTYGWNVNADDEVPVKRKYLAKSGATAHCTTRILRAGFMPQDIPPSDQWNNAKPLKRNTLFFRKI